MVYHYELSGEHDDDDPEPLPNLAKMKGQANALRDGVASLLRGTPYDAVATRRQMRALEAMEQVAVDLATDLANITNYWRRGM